MSYRNKPGVKMPLFRILLPALCLFAATAWGASGDGDYRALYRQGIESNKRGEISQAITYYSKAITLRKNSPELYFVRGRAYKQNDELDKAIADLTRAITLKKDYAEAYNHRAVAYVGKGMTREATADFRKGCSLGHKDACANLKKLQEMK